MFNDTFVLFSLEQENEMYRKFKALELCEKKVDLLLNQELVSTQLIEQLKAQSFNLRLMNSKSEELINVYKLSIDNQRKQIEELNKVNLNLSYSNLRLKKQRNTLFIISSALITTTILFIVLN